MSTTYAQFQELLDKALADPSFPDYGKRVIRDLRTRDTVDALNVLEYLTGLWTGFVNESLRIALLPIDMLTRAEQP